MTQTLLAVFPNSKDLLALEPEELGGVVLEVASEMFNINGLLDPLFGRPGSSYPSDSHRPVELALAEALSWLVSQGLIIRDPGQPAQWYVRTRRARALRSRADVAAFQKGHMLPVHLLQTTLAEKVWPQFLRGDHDIAVFQAFKEVEVAVRKAANDKGAGYPHDLVGVPLMRKAFHPENGPLSAMHRVMAEREGEMAFFAGAIGHAKNPTGHRDVNLVPQEAARLVVFASHLLSIIEQRSV
jgi:uncharacterized protein (TIGR02391 family)